ncbi:mesocentin [Mycolicibacterium smegmatis]|uniref:mesocentin n=1 Tax=Mycolicibacterium smegmatis TaxID=1772 RepID=UPI0023DA11F8|nr:mesocentin [Mycolicibacterium smegmatis]MDF1917930.1 mesocentin [Mycolicibacterium smegmatis]
MRRLVTVLIGLAALVLMSACGSGSSSSPTAGGSDKSAKPGAVSNPASNAQYCAQNRDPRCPKGSYHGTHVLLTTAGGYWDANGNPIDGGPMGADGSTGNNHTQEYCARNEDPGCPMGSYVAPDAIKNPDGSPSYVVCEGTICTNPNHGAADPDGDTPASDEVTGAPDDDPPAITPAPDTDPGENSPRDAQTPDQPALPEQQPDDGDAFDPGSVDGPGDEPNVDEP